MGTWGEFAAYTVAGDNGWVVFRRNNPFLKIRFLLSVALNSHCIEKSKTWLNQRQVWSTNDAPFNYFHGPTD